MSTAQSTTPSRRSRKFKAILAGGIVLGVGAAATLAAWTDDEWAIGDFQAGSFNLEGSTNGSDYTEHEIEGDAATLGFETGADNLSPGDSYAAGFAVRLDDTTSYDATVELANVTDAAENVTGLTYGVVQVESFAVCTPEATGTSIVAAGTALDAGTGSFEVTAGPDTSAGAPVNLCFQVTANDELSQNQSTTATWQFTATSVE
ncbi:hypothetical protein GCM10022261_00280 [Brevibacterium daeguense]|uniref:SipW-cognate class signal peptide n=1 Tax=Brevibacterium daeguense TaxID=909936 RepID=A0ABP8EET1_9MICO|nr:SipW-dependent-type signal peptide-containing protein [Brevibacterium daeguense]